MLPAGHAEQFRTAAREAANADATNSVSQTGDDSRAAGGQEPRKTHVVSRGESLWQIARDNQTSVVRLQQLNHLQGHTIRQGEVLQLDDVD
jgi:LysM repeat protein